MNPQRRRLLTASAVAALALPLGLHAAGPEPAVSPTEDLMREHGLLDRILLIYEEGVRRIGADQPLDPAPLHLGADLVRRFIEEYHEKLEEQHLFPMMEQHGMAPLVKTLREQHDAGRRLTAAILQATVPEHFAASRPEVARHCTTFVRMYRPHAAREDTVLFPAFLKVIGSTEAKRLGDLFEREEERRFGKEGFERIVDQVATLEGQLGIGELARFTP